MKRLFALLLVATMLTGMTATAATPLTDDEVAYGYAAAHDMHYIPRCDGIHFGCSVSDASLDWDPALVEGVSYLHFCAISDDQTVYWGWADVEYMTAYTEAAEYFTKHPEELKAAKKLLKVEYQTEADGVAAVLNNNK